MTRVTRMTAKYVVTAFHSAAIFVLPVNAFHLCIAGGQMFNGMRSVTMSIAEIVSSMAVIQSRNS